MRGLATTSSDDLVERLRRHGDLYPVPRMAMESLSHAAADEIEALREVVRTVSSVLGDPLHFADERLGRAVERAHNNGSPQDTDR